jgi:hypothetical protein
MPRRPNGIGLTNNQELTLLEKAMSGDMVLSILPATVTPAPTAAAWTRDVVIELQTAAGEVHSWANITEATILSVGDTGGGTATIVTTSIVLVNGQITVVVSGDAATWANTETDTLTVGDMTIMGYTVSGGTSVETFTTP